MLRPSIYAWGRVAAVPQAKGLGQRSGRAQARPSSVMSAVLAGKGVGCFSGVRAEADKAPLRWAGAMELLPCVLLWKLAFLQSECDRVELGSPPELGLGRVGCLLSEMWGQGWLLQKRQLPEILR